MTPDTAMPEAIRIPPILSFEDFERQALDMMSGPPAPIENEPVLRVISATTLAARTVPPRAWHVERLVPDRTVTSMYGDGATGKSLLVLQLGVSTVTGTAWIGRAVERGGCIILTAEDDIDEVHRRLADICRAEGCHLADLAGLDIIPLAGEDAVLAAPDRPAGGIKPTPLFMKLCQTVRDRRPRLVILDTAADLYAGDELNRAQVRQFISMLRGLAIRYRTAVLLLAHPSVSGMNSGTGLSGSTAWNNSVRSRLYLRRLVTREGDRQTEDDPDVRVLSSAKSNYGRAGEEIRLRWEDGRFVTDSAGPLAAGPASVSGSDKADRIFLAMLEAYTLEGRPVNPTAGPNYAPAVFAKDSRSEGAGKTALAAAMNRLLGSGRIVNEEVGPPSRRTRRLALAGD